VAEVKSTFNGRGVVLDQDTTSRGVYKDALDCWLEENCSLYPTLAESSCQMAKCGKQTTALFVSYSCQADRKLLGSCISQREIAVCPLIDVWAIFLIAFSMTFAE
jgi:hypothetical protein